MSGIGFRGTGGLPQPDQHNEVSTEILASRFKSDSIAARGAVELIQSRRGELASLISLRYHQLDDDAAAHLLLDSNLSAAWDRTYNMMSTRMYQSSLHDLL